MGEVYRGRDTRLKREVAIKVLPETVARDPAALARFQRDAQSIAALNHPNIVTIYSVEDAGGVVFFTMELVEGKPLSDLIGNRGVPLPSLLELAIPLADAVSAAHQKGITHRDLKPANVMVRADGQSIDIDERTGNITDQPQTIGLMTGILHDLAISRSGQELALTETEGSMNLTRLPLTVTGSAAAGPEEVPSAGQVYDGLPSVLPDGRLIAYTIPTATM
jgi:serine/threonine protein kinase